MDALSRSRNIVQSFGLSVCLVLSFSARAQIESKVFGGTVVKESEWIGTHAVAMLQGNWMTCSATVIAEGLALTAAHCVDRGVSYDIGFGINPERSGTPRRRVYRWVIHPDYDPTFEAKHPSDLALLFFSGGLPKGYTPVILASAKRVPKKNSLLTVAGYGSKTRAGTNGFGVLRKADLKVLSASAKESQIKMDQSKKKGVCLGDSGGPAFQKDSVNTYVQHGIASWVTSRTGRNGQSECGNITSYTRVGHFLDWISEESGLEFK